MSLEERIEEVMQERFMLIPNAKFNEVSKNAPVSNRLYSQLEPVQMEAIKVAAAMTDNEMSVVTPMGGLIQLGHQSEEHDGFILDDLAVVPMFAGPQHELPILNYSQIPNMIDDKPPYEHAGDGAPDFGRIPSYKDYVDSVEGQEKPVEQVLGLAAHPFISAMLNNADAGYPMAIQDMVYSNLSFLRRGWCETDTRFIQLLPYITFYKKTDAGIKIFVYQRGKGVGEERLAMGCSVGVGGHVNPIDFLSMQSRLEKHPSQKEVVSTFTGRLMVESFWGGIINNIFRELKEEISVTDTSVGGYVDMDRYICDQAVSAEVALEQWLFERTSFFLTLADSRTEEAHLGMFIAIEVPECFDIKTNEESLHDVGFVDLDDLYCADGAPEAPWSTPTPLECWSRIIINALYETKKFIADNKVELKGRSHFMRNQLLNSGNHLVDAETVAKIPAADRWKIGTISASFGQEYRFYGMNAFLRA